MKYCIKCGNQLKDDAKFCNKCGTPCYNNKKETSEDINTESSLDKANADPYPIEEVDSSKEAVAEGLSKSAGSAQRNESDEASDVKKEKGSESHY